MTIEDKVIEYKWLHHDGKSEYIIVCAHTLKYVYIKYGKKTRSYGVCAYHTKIRPLLLLKYKDITLKGYHYAKIWYVENFMTKAQMRLDGRIVFVIIRLDI